MATNALTARKPIDDIIKDGERHGLSKTSGKVSITALGIGAIIGACIFVGLCYAGLAALLPVSGSTYTYATVGELAAWIIGWDLILEYAAGAATVAVGWSGYAVSLLGSLGLELPRRLLLASGSVVTFAGGSHGHADGLHAEALGGLCPVPRRWSHLPE